MTTAQNVHDNGSNATATVLLVLTCILTASSVTSTILRCLIRVSQRTCSWDDALIIAATALTIARTGLQIHSIQIHMESNDSNVQDLQSSPSTFTSTELMEAWLTQLLLFPAICFLKCSCSLLLLKPKHKPTNNVVMWSVLLLISGLIITNLETAIIFLAECSPVKAFWDSSAGSCRPDTARRYSLYVQMVYSIFFDFVFTLVPLYIVCTPQLRSRERFLMCALAGMGFIATASVAVQVSMMDYEFRTSLVELYKSAIFANIELHIGIVAVNAACGYQIYASPPFSSRILDEGVDFEMDIKQNANGNIVISDGKHDEAQYVIKMKGLTSISEATDLDNTHSNNNEHNSNLNPVNTEDSHFPSVAGHDADLQQITIFPEKATSILLSPLPYRNASPVSSIRRKISSVKQDPSAHDQNNDDSLTDLVTRSESEQPSLQYSIHKVTEYFVESTRLSQSSFCPPGNGNWFINGKLSV